MDLCEEHLIQLKAKEKHEFEEHSKWVKGHPNEAMELAQAYLDAMVNGAEGLIVRDIIPDKHTASKVISRDWRQPVSEPQ